MTNGSDSPQDRPRCSLCGHEVFPEADQTPDTAPCSYCGNMLWFFKQEDSDFVILNLTANLDLENANLERVGELLIGAARVPRVVLNMGNIEYVSSTFLGRLLAMQKRIDAARGNLILCGLNPVVRETFQITKLDQFFTFSDDPTAAGTV